ncbi:hypothetical protein [Bradyrhizobium vignae]|uniref:hypothetical protein n=1 Tax=Bradyrhizobium vignae TaxID=1549949 RepID=UPI00100A82AE|nr:hypothetical protein [Bradyrhizobium vignae]RXH05268.1 hypothetical protein EAV90_07715 [Bradyrhizobium vignae]
MPQDQQQKAVIALAGRRIDAPDAEAKRFPLGAVPLVRQRLADVFRQEQAEALVCSAACGADLIALEEAGRMGIRRRIVLPFAPARFRETSVTDRPGDWGGLFDRVMGEVGQAGDVVVLDAGDGDAAYAAANDAIVREALALCRAETPPCRPVAVIVNEGSSRGAGDATEQFRVLGLAAGFVERPVRTN